MIVLGTGVLAEAMKPAPHAAVLAWLDAQAAETLFVCSVSVAELSFGIGAMPAGRGRGALAAALEGVVEVFAGRVLEFDTAAALRCGELAARARAAGRAFGAADLYVAAVADARGFAVAARDGGALAAVGVRVVDPWG
jgi:predicted nucleic acid-binding protein